MDHKITILFLLISVIIALSHLGDGSFGRMRRHLLVRNWREMVPGRRRV